MNVQHNIIEVIEERRLRGFGHLKRMRNNIVRKMILTRLLKTGGERGSLGMSECIDKSMTSKDLTEEDADVREFCQSKISLR